jgi:hypothetical protein
MMARSAVPATVSVNDAARRAPRLRTPVAVLARGLIALHVIVRVINSSAITVQRYVVEREPAVCTCWEWLPNPEEPL